MQAYNIKTKTFGVVTQKTKWSYGHKESLKRTIRRNAEPFAAKL